VQLVDQIVGQQIVPECAAAKGQDLSAGLAFELCNLLVSVLRA